MKPAKLRLINPKHTLSSSSHMRSQRHSGTHAQSLRGAGGGLGRCPAPRDAAHWRAWLRLLPCHKSRRCAAHLYGPETTAPALPPHRLSLQQTDGQTDALPPPQHTLVHDPREPLPLLSPVPSVPVPCAGPGHNPCPLSHTTCSAHSHDSQPAATAPPCILPCPQHAA